MTRIFSAMKKSNLLILCLGFWLLCFGAQNTQGQNFALPEQFAKPVIVTIDTLEFPEHELSYTPTYFVVAPPDPINCKGVMCYATHHDNIGAGRRGQGMEAILGNQGRGIGRLLHYMWEEYNLAIMIWNTFSPWRKAGPQVNEAFQSPEQARMLNSLFDAVAVKWQSDMEKLCSEFSFPKPQESDWFFGASSDGSKHMVYMLPALPPGTFTASWFHGSTLFRNPSPEWKDESILMTVGQSDYGYPNYLDYYRRCQVQGYTSTLFRPDWKGHGATSVAHSYAQRFFDWVMDGKPTGDEGHYYADVLNLEVLPERRKNLIPEEQRVWLPNKDFADSYLENPLEGGDGLTESDEDGLNWTLKSSVPTRGQWLTLPEIKEAGNVVSIKFQMKKADDALLGDHIGEIVFKEALNITPQGQKTPVKDDLVFKQDFNVGWGMLSSGSGNRIGNALSLRSVEERAKVVDYELQYHKDRKSVSVFANGQRLAMANADVHFGSEYTFGVGGEINNIQFGEPTVGAFTQDSLYVLSDADEQTGLQYKLQAAEPSGAVKWSKQALPKQKKRNLEFTTTMMTTQPNSQGGRNGFLTFEHVNNPANFIQIGLFFGRSSNSIQAFGTGPRPFKVANTRFPRNKPVKLKVRYDSKTQMFNAFINDGKKPALSFKRGFPIKRVGNSVRGLNAETNFGEISIRTF